MTGALLTIALFVTLGSIFAARSSGVRPVALFTASAYLFGSGAAAIALQILALLGVAWTLPRFLIVATLLGACGAFVPRVREAEPPATRATRIASWGAAFLVATFAALHALFATRAPLSEWDFLAIWGLKARTFLAAGTIDWEFLGRFDNLFANPDYPPLLPLLFDANALVSGGWDGRWIGLFYTAFGLAAFAVAWFSVRRATSSAVVLASVALLFLFPSFSNRIGLAEAPLIAFAAAAVVLIRRGLILEDRRFIIVGGLLLGCAALTKNEGLALAAAVAIAAGVYRPRPRLLVGLVPGLILAGWWQILRAMHDVPTLRAMGSVSSRVGVNLGNVGEWAPLLWSKLENPLFWIVLVLLAAIAGVRALWRERFLAVVVLLQCGAILGAYLVSHVNIRNEIVYSWERLSHQIALLAALLVAHALTSDERSENERGGPEPAS